MRSKPSRLYSLGNVVLLGNLHIAFGWSKKASIPSHHFYDHVGHHRRSVLRLFLHSGRETPTELQEAFLTSFLQFIMLWQYSLNWSGFIESSASVSDARKALIQKLQSDPNSVISKLVPAEPTPHTLVELGKRVFNIK